MLIANALNEFYVDLQSVPSHYCSFENWRCIAAHLTQDIRLTRPVASRIVSDVLTRNRDNPEFEISVLTCSITYMHVNSPSRILNPKCLPRQAPTTLPLGCPGDVQSANDVPCQSQYNYSYLTTYLQLFYQDNPELLVPVNYDEIRSLTARMHQEISSRTIDAPSWEIVRTAKLASRIYAPLGTRMSLGDYVRVTRTFVEAFKASDRTISNEDEKVEYTKEDVDLVRLRRDLKV